MNHTYSVYKLIIALSAFVLIAFSACKDKADKNENIPLDSNNINQLTEYNNDTTSTTSLNSLLKDYSGKYKASINWADYYKDNKSYANRDLKNKNLIFPVFKEKIKFLLQSNVTDTILIYSGKRLNSFVINITKGEELFKKLSERNNGVIIIHVNDLEFSQKLYLTKKPNDFEHKEKKVIEFYLKAELIDANNINVKDDLLEDKFKLEK